MLSKKLVIWFGLFFGALIVMNVIQIIHYSREHDMGYAAFCTFMMLWNTYFFIDVVRHWGKAAK
jgi:succinate-acetate transporter protein